MDQLVTVFSVCHSFPLSRYINKGVLQRQQPHLGWLNRVSNDRTDADPGVYVKVEIVDDFRESLLVPGNVHQELRVQEETEVTTSVVGKRLDGL